MERIAPGGIEYLPARGGQTSPKLYLAFGQHLHDDTAYTTHGQSWRVIVRGTLLRAGDGGARDSMPR